MNDTAYTLIGVAIGLLWRFIHYVKR